MAGYTLDALKAGRQWKEMGKAVFSYDPKARLPLIQAQTLVVSETGESINPYTQLYQEIQGLIPRSSVAIIEAGVSKKLRTFLTNSSAAAMLYRESPASIIATLLRGMSP